MTAGPAARARFDGGVAAALGDGPADTDFGTIAAPRGGGITVRWRDMWTLRSGACLNDEVVNAYISIIETADTPKRCLCVSTHGGPGGTVGFDGPVGFDRGPAGGIDVI